MAYGRYQVGRSRGLPGILAVAIAATVLFVLPAGAATAATIVAATGLNITASEPQQTGRLDFTTPNTCGGPPKFALVVNNTTPRHYRMHTFRSSITNPVCVTVAFSSLTSCTLFSTAYIPSFNPANILENYAADLGSPTSTTGSYSFTLGGGQPIAVVVHESTPGAGCGAYSLTATTDRPWAGSLPTITGAPTVGTVLTGSNSNWGTTPAPTQVTQQWVRCNADGSSCTDIPGATAATYTVSDADLGSTIRFRNHATDPSGTSTSESRYVEPFIPIENTTGSLGPGDRVHNGVFIRNSVETRCNAPTAAPTILQPATSFLYDTYPVTSLLNESVCLVARAVPTTCISGVTAEIFNPAFDPVAGLAANYAGNSGADPAGPSSTSVPIGAGERREVVVSQGPSGGACSGYDVKVGANTPFATARPSVSGTPAEGETLTAANGTWTGTPALSHSWRRCDESGGNCSQIDGATGSTYTFTAADAGSTVRVRVTATQGQSVSSDSAPTGTVAAAPPNDGGGGEVEDRDPPDGVIVKVKVKRNKAKATFRSDEPGSTYECRLDKKRFKSCTSPWRYRKLKGGKHKFFVLATDPAGNEDETAAKAKFRVGRRY